MSSGLQPRPDLPSVPGRGVEELVWHRLHPLSPVVRAGRALVFLLLVVLPQALAGRERGSANALVIDAVIAGLLVAVGVVSWLVTRWRVEDGSLRIETGLLRRSSRRFPLAQIQAIDTVRPGLARILGLAELRLRMGGNVGGTARLAYLSAGHADVLRGRLLALARGQTEGTPEPAARVLVSVPVGRLVASMLLSRFGLLVEAVLAGLIVTAVVAPSVAAAALGGSIVSVVGMVSVVWRQFNSAYRLTVAEAPDGLRIRLGLVETTAETIPRGRVQAIRMVQPLLWRPFGWCRMQVDVAGRQRAEGEAQTESHPLRSILPVGTRQEAARLLDVILPDAPAALWPAPPRVRLKTPLRYHYLSWGRTDGALVTTSGRVARITDWVPLAKVQSLRWVQGPLQRWLRLATIHADTAGRSVHAAIRDRDTGEASRVLVELIDLCAAARERDREAGGPRPEGSAAR